ncbi:unnamed protein product [Amaranthus hypochondriacus]
MTKAFMIFFLVASLALSANVEGRVPIFGSKWASCPASCAHLSEGNQCYNYCVGLGYRNGGECYYNGSPYGNCCCNTD